MKIKPLIVFSFGFILNSIASAAGFPIATYSSFLWQGLDPATGESCFVTMRTNSLGLINYLSFEGNIQGWALTPPPSLTKSETGFQGTTRLIQGHTTEDFAYEPHAASEGIILRRSTVQTPGQELEIQLFGASLAQLQDLVFSDHGPDLWFDGECRNLTRLKVD